MKGRSGVASAGALTRSIGALQSKTFDIAIVGGGMVGASIVRRAAKAGLSAVLLEEADFASDASSKTTDITDGGLRDLTLRDVQPVRAEAIERERLHGMAPHLVEPVTMVVPFRSRLKWITFRLDFLFYKALGLFASSDEHRRWSIDEVHAAEPTLRVEKNKVVWTYREYVVDRARLVIAVLRDAVMEGAQCANYVRVSSIEHKRNQYSLNVRDLLSGVDVSVRSRCVVNTAKPWPEELVADGKWRDPRGEAEELQFVKGVHIAVPHHSMPINNLVFMEAEDSQIIFAFPRGQVTCIGATSTPYHGDLARWPLVTIEDINYLLAPVSRYFEDSQLQPADVVASWAGLRPAMPRIESATVRNSGRTEVVADSNGLISVTVGKFSSSHLITQEVMNYVESFLGCILVDEEDGALLPGGDFSSMRAASGAKVTARLLSSEVIRIATLYEVSEEVSLRLVRLYGAEVEKILGYRPRPLSSSVFAEEVDWAVSIEGATSIEDVLYRRLRCVWFEPQELAVLAPAVSEHMANILRWDISEHRRQRIRFEERIAFDLSAIPLAN